VVLSIIFIGLLGSASGSAALTLAGSTLASTVSELYKAWRLGGATILSAEEIYDASTDDELFRTLARRIPEGFGARSCVLHWRSPGQARESEISLSAHFSAADMNAYDALPPGSDIWAQAINTPGARNRMWLLDDLVAPAEYEASAVYNNWVRWLGDDTFHCMGGAFENDRFIFEIGLHRGRAQEPFNRDDLARLKQMQRPLLQMIEVRQQLFARRSSSSLMSSALDSIGTAIAKLNENGQIMYRNEAAEDLFARNDGLSERDGRLIAHTAGDQSVLEQAIRRAAASREPHASAVAIRRSTGDVYACSLMPVFLDGHRTTLLIVKDPSFRDTSLAGRLRAIYGLTDAEAQVAIAIANGATVDGIAAERNTRAETVRTQFKSLALKMGCRRQNEVAGLVHGLPLLNSSANRRNGRS